VSVSALVAPQVADALQISHGDLQKEAKSTQDVIRFLLKR
jgi:hypothetical protein